MLYAELKDILRTGRRITLWWGETHDDPQVAVRPFRVLPEREASWAGVELTGSAPLVTWSFVLGVVGCLRGSLVCVTVTEKWL